MNEIFFLKLIVAVIMVVGLSVIAEYSSPRIAGVLSGYPTGSAISLFFFGLEINPQFAADSALYNMIGLVAMLVFIFAYYKTSLKHNIFLSSLVAFIAYLTTIFCLRFIEANAITSFLVPTISIFLFVKLFQPIQNVLVTEKIKPTYKIFLFRAFVAAAIILIITGVAHLVGPEWSGLFSAFPTTLFPLMLIIHLTYGTAYVHTIIKNVPIGILSLILYSLSVSIVYPLYGIYWGTLFSFGVATIYLIGFQFFQLKRK